MNIDNMIKFDKLANPLNNKIYYIVESKRETFHPLIPTYNMSEILIMIKGTKNSIRVKSDNSNLVFIDVDTNSESEAKEFLKSIENHNCIIIKSQTPNHYHVFFKWPKENIELPLKIKYNISIWDFYGQQLGGPISLGPTLPNGYNNREFLEFPDEIDELPKFLYEKE